jgi:alkylation response protein AidB-like acyl-CoA dehydrogenase
MAVLTEEQVLIRDAARAWTRGQAPVAAFRRMRDAAEPLGYAVETWRSIADMGWAGVIVPEAYGGLGLGYAALGLILEEVGRTLCASPLLGSAAATNALVLAGDEAQKAAHLAALASGGRIAALAVDEGPRHTPERTALEARRSGDGYVLTGEKRFVLEGAAADLLVVSARTGGEAGATDGLSLFLVQAGAPGVERRPLGLIDSRGAADIAFRGVAVPKSALIGEEGRAWPIVEAVLDRARAAVCAEMLGLGAQAFEMILDYLKIREQFGQVIGAFQALQHRAAKMFGELELARSCVEAALAACDRDAPDTAELVSVAKVKMGETLFLISNELIQMHGGIGMTDAHDAGLYLKRARALETMFGNRAFHRDRFARLRGF